MNPDTTKLTVLAGPIKAPLAVTLKTETNTQNAPLLCLSQQLHFTQAFHLQRGRWSLVSFSSALSGMGLMVTLKEPCSHYFSYILFHILEISRVFKTHHPQTI